MINTKVVTTYKDVEFAMLIFDNVWLESRLLS